ncbi:metallophosphoesterase family protein, partial [Chloroflexota bacterium]
SAPLVGGDGTIYVVSGSDLLAMNPDGSEKWRLTPGIVYTTETAYLAMGSDGTIYFSGRGEGSSYALLAISEAAPPSGAPIAHASDISGQPKVMYPDTPYTVTAKYFDPDGRDDLKHCYLRLRHPGQNLTMMWDQATDDFWPYAGEEGANYLEVIGDSTEITEGELEGYELAWTFNISDQWPEVENAIDFGVYAMDDQGEVSAWDYDSREASFFRDKALEVTIRDSETEDELDSAWVDEEFRIHITAPQGWPEAVRFSVDDIQDGVQAGPWSKSYEWDALDAARWDEENTRTVAYSFATGGPKEIWVRANYGGGVTATNSTTAFANFAFAHITDTHIGQELARPGGWDSEEPLPTSWLAAALEVMQNEDRVKLPQFVLATGDLVDAAYMDYLYCRLGPCIPRRALLGYYSAFLKAVDDHTVAPVYTVPGNHDHYSVFAGTWWPYDARAGLGQYNAYLSNRRPFNAVTIGQSEAEHNDYLFEYGGVEFIGIDSGRDNFNCLEFWEFRVVNSDGPTDDQIIGLKGLNKDVPKVVFMHHPLITEDGRGAIAHNAYEFRDFTLDYSVQLVLAGHKHYDWVYYDHPAAQNVQHVITPSPFDLDEEEYGGYRMVYVEQAEDGKLQITPQSVTDVTECDVRAIEATIGSPVDFEVYDSDGQRVRITKDGVIDDEIPYAICIASPYIDNDDDAVETPLGAVTLFNITQEYTYVVKGKSPGTYKLSVRLWNGSEESTPFMGDDIPCTEQSVHQYTIDWGALSQGGEGVTVQVDSDGDGVFEHTITSEHELTADEFILQTETVIDIEPDTLNLKAKRKYVSAYIELPLGYNLTQINVSSISLNGTVPALTKPTQLGDYDNDGVPDLMVKFDASAVKALLTSGDEVEMTIAGEVDGTQFMGIDTIRVMDPQLLPYYTWILS